MKWYQGLTHSREYYVDNHPTHTTFLLGVRFALGLLAFLAGALAVMVVIGLISSLIHALTGQYVT